MSEELPKLRGKRNVYLRHMRNMENEYNELTMEEPKDNVELKVKILKVNF